MKKCAWTKVLLGLGSIFFLLDSCKSKSESGPVTEKNGVTTIQVDVNEVRDAKLSDYFEPEIEYLILKETEDPASQIGEVSKLLFHKDRYIILDTFKGKCLQFFDQEGNFLKKVRLYGLDYGKYIEVEDVQVYNDTIYLLAQPLKILKLDLEGKFLEEIKLPVLGRTFHIDKATSYFHIKGDSRSEHLVYVIDHKGFIVQSYFPTYPSIFYGRMRDWNNFFPNEDSFYFTRTYLDTIFQFNENGYQPRFIFDFGNKGFDHSDLLEKESSLEFRDMSKYLQEKAGMTLSAFGLSTDKFIFNRLTFNEKYYLSVLNKYTQSHDLIHTTLINDIDESFDMYLPSSLFDNGKVAQAMMGVRFYNKAVEKKGKLTLNDWKSYQNGKGRAFVETAFDAMQSENYVIILLTLKK